MDWYFLGLLDLMNCVYTEASSFTFYTYVFLSKLIYSTFKVYMFCQYTLHIYTYY